MDTQHLSATAPARPRITADKHPIRRPGPGLVHENSRHTTRFTVIGNHLTQHVELSLLAIGLACHLQSLPAGSQAGIKSLAARFPEGTTRIAAALRELEAHGYLRRERVRTSTGRIVTRTTSCNRPGHRAEDAPPARKPRQAPPRGKALPEVPQPACPAPELVRAATGLLAGLRRLDPRLLLSACDTAHLAPGVAAWLERDVAPSAVGEALTRDLPAEDLRRPAALLAHRLAALLPPPPPFRAPAAPAPVRHPFQDCDGCGLVFRAPAPGRCRDCRPVLPQEP
ncbi:helix-turn-helix domain-containing protein [Streptomyces sp. NPDC093094]|uniref:helix-turn-helix domain-containing protein n=1 Tax=Streptomyces sp. NPDC093094 TaxID=3366026 RepID=UPI0037F53C64